MNHLTTTDTNKSLASSVFTEFEASDLVLPKLLLMQGLSEYVADERAKMGDMVNSVTGEVLGGKDKPVEIIPFYMTRNYVVSVKQGDKFEFRGVVPATPANANWKTKEHREEMTSEGLTRRDYSLDYFVLLADEVKSGVAFPYQVSFRRTSIQTGKQLYTSLFTSGGKPTTTWKLGCKKRENDLGNFYVYELSKGNKLTPEQMGAVEKWAGIISAGSYKVDDSEHATTKDDVSL